MLIFAAIIYRLLQNRTSAAEEKLFICQRPEMTFCLNHLALNLMRYLKCAHVRVFHPSLPILLQSQVADNWNSTIWIESIFPHADVSTLRDARRVIFKWSFPALIIIGLNPEHVVCLRVWHGNVHHVPAGQKGSDNRKDGNLQTAASYCSIKPGDSVAS